MFNEFKGTDYCSETEDFPYLEGYIKNIPETHNKFRDLFKYEIIKSIQIHFQELNHYLTKAF